MASTNHDLPAAFQNSYRDRKSFPCNLILSSLNTYPTALQASKARLDSAARHLFEVDEENLEVKFRDLDPGTVSKRNLFELHEVSDWLGIREHPASEDGQNIVFTANKKDPKSRFIYIYGESSRSPLKLNREMLAQILTFHQVMPDYLDLMAIFGLQSVQRDLRYSNFRHQLTMRERFKSEAIPSLDRSGLQYQMCYNLKGITLKHEDTCDPHRNEWSPRQAAFYHRFDIVNGNALWIVTKGGTDIQQRYKELTSAASRPEDRAFNTVQECFSSSLSAQLLFCYWSTEDWRTYLRWLEEMIEMDGKMAVLGPRGRNHHYKTYTARDVQLMQGWDEMVSEAIAVLEGNREVVASLRKFYQNLKENADFYPRQNCAEDIDMFCNQLNNIMDDFRMQIGRAKVLVKITADRKEIVMQYLQTQAIESAERMEGLNWGMVREASVVRIITIVTLFYLPASFVSSFLSTGIIKYQNPDNPGDGSSNVAMHRWLQLALPLTFLTLLSAYCGQKWVERSELAAYKQAANKRQIAGTENESDERDSASISAQSGTSPNQQENAAIIPSPQSTLVMGAQNERPPAGSVFRRLLLRGHGNQSSLLPFHKELTSGP